MIVDCSNPDDLLELYSLVEEARKKGKKLKVVYDRKVHTDPQRKFLHFAMSYFAHCYGCTLTEVKEMHLKRYCLPDFFDSGKRDKGNAQTHKETTTGLLRQTRLYLPLHRNSSRKYERFVKITKTHTYNGSSRYRTIEAAVGGVTRLFPMFKMYEDII